jgi:hypothetical protein
VNAEETVGRISVFGDVVAVYVGGDSRHREAGEAVNATLAECLDATAGSRDSSPVAS